MKKITLYSSRRPAASPASSEVEKVKSSSVARPSPGSKFKGSDVPPGAELSRAGRDAEKAGEVHESHPGGPGGSRSRLKNFVARHRRPVWLAAYVLVGAILLAGFAMIAPPAREITQEEIRGAVLHVLDTQTLPSPEARAYEAIRGSVVRVRGLGHDEKRGEDIDRSVGTGVVIVDKGVILTNLHVVADAERVQVVFADGSESEATVTGVRPEHDLAVLQAQKVPDDLQAATMASTADLRMGDHVFAVGFPFAIGPSLTAGVISGLTARVPLAAGKTPAHESHPVRRRSESREAPAALW